jgi:hypothetical protein
MLAMYRESPGEWRLCELEPGIVEDRLLIRDLGEPQHEEIPAEDILHLAYYDFWDGESATGVYPFVDIVALDESLVTGVERYAANIKLPPYQQQLFLQSGYDKTRPFLETLRAEELSLVSIRAAALFAAISANRGNREGETMYYKLWPYIRDDHVGDMSPSQIRRVIGSALTKNFSETYAHEIWDWCEEIESVLNSGIKDKLLRRTLAWDVGVARGLGMVKLSFMLELLGNNVGCLDTHMLAMLTGTREQAEKRLDVFNARSRKKWSAPWKPFTEKAVKTYEFEERRMYLGNEFYDKRDPMGIARTQWMSWEVLRGEATEHLAITATLRAHMEGREEIPELDKYLGGLKGAAQIKRRRLGGRWREAKATRKPRKRRKPKKMRGQQEFSY